MKGELRALLARAEEKLRAARLLLEGDAWGDAASRAYYAAFHAVSAVGRQRPRDKAELMANVRRYLWSTQRRPGRVRSYFRHPSVRYAA